MENLNCDSHSHVCLNKLPGWGQLSHSVVLPFTPYEVAAIFRTEITSQFLDSSTAWSSQSHRGIGNVVAEIADRSSGDPDCFAGSGAQAFRTTRASAEIGSLCLPAIHSSAILSIRVPLERKIISGSSQGLNSVPAPRSGLTNRETRSNFCRGKSPQLRKADGRTTAVRIAAHPGSLSKHTCECESQFRFSMTAKFQ